MARVRIARHPKPAVTEAPVSKVQAVRTALAEGAAKPEDGVPFIKTRFGLDITPQHFSATKSLLKKREGQVRGKPGRKPGRGRSRAVEGYLAPPAKPRAHGEGDLLAAIEAIKPLVARHGADQVKRLADLLG